MKKEDTKYKYIKTVDQNTNDGKKLYIVQRERNNILVNK